MESGVVWGVGLVLGIAVVLASGFRLSRLGAPYGSALLNAHKLVDLAAVIVVGVAIYRRNLAAALSTLEWIIVGLAGLFVLATFATGGVASGAKSPPPWVVTIHKITPYPAVALIGLALYVIAGGR